MPETCPGCGAAYEAPCTYCGARRAPRKPVALYRGKPIYHAPNFSVDYRFKYGDLPTAHSIIGEFAD